MKPVMLATDGSPTAEAATDTAVEFAKLLGAPLVVVTAWSIPSTVVGYGGVPMGPEVGEASKEDAERVVQSAAARAREAGVEVEGFTLRGFPVEEICRSVETHEPQLLVVGSHGWGAMKRLVFGSVSTGVLHHASCPVLVVPVVPDEETAGDREREAVEA